MISFTFAFPKKGCIGVPNKQVLYLPVKWHGKYAEVAQLVEQLICNQQVVGSTPFLGSVVLE
jgi:hypothetical protein